MITKADCTVYITGIGKKNEMLDLPVITVGGVVPTQHVDGLTNFHQYAHTRASETIHSGIRLESFKYSVYDESCKDRQTIITLDGYITSTNFVDGLAYLPCRLFTDME